MKRLKHFKEVLIESLEILRNFRGVGFRGEAQDSVSLWQKLQQQSCRLFKACLVLISVGGMGVFVLSPVQASVQVITVGTAVYDRYVSLGGTVIPFKKVTITAQIAGEVNYIAGIEGDTFKAGELLISTDDKVLLARRAAAMAQFQKAMAAYQNADAQYNRELWSPKSEQPLPGMALPNMMDQMFTRPFSDAMGVGDKDAENRANLTAVLTQVKQAIADMEAAKAHIAEIDVQLSHTKSRAPFDGVVVKKMVEAGDAVQPGQALLEFAKSKHLSIEVNVPVSLMGEIKKGAVLKAHFDNQQPIPVRVSQVFPVADALQHTVKVKFDLPLGAPAAPGMYAKIYIKNAASQNLQFPVVPSLAVRKLGSLPTVYVVDSETHKVIMKVVRLGRVTENGYFIVLAGLKQGEKVVMNPPENIVSGMKLEKGKLMAAVK